MGRLGLRQRLRQRMRWERLPGSGPGEVYERVAAGKIEEAATGKEGFIMSDEMRVALENVEPEVRSFATSDGAEIQGAERRLKRTRYNSNAPVRLDWHGIPWLTALRQAASDGCPDFFTPSHAMHKNNHNTITGNPSIEGIMQTHGAPHPVSMAFQYWNKDKTRKTRPVYLPPRAVGAIFAEVYNRYREAVHVPEKILHVAAAKSLWANATVYHLVEDVGIYWYFKLLAEAGDLEAIEAVNASEVSKFEDVQTVAKWAQTNAREEILETGEEVEGEGPVGTLVSSAALLKSYLSSGEVGAKEKAMELFVACKHLPLATFATSATRNTTWLTLVDILTHTSLTHADVSIILDILVPYFPEPELWPEELLELVIAKQPTVAAGYRIFKRGVNAGFPRYHKSIEVPPPRGGFRGLLSLCATKHDAKVCKKVYEFMLREECRPARAETHYMLVTLAASEPQTFVHMLKWVVANQEVQVSDFTLVRGLEELAPGSAGVRGVNEAFRLCTEILGGVDAGLVRAYYAKLLAVTENPMEAFVELMAIATSTLFRFVYDEKVEFPLRIGSKEATHAVLDTLEPLGVPANLAILTQLISSCHDQWSGSGYNTYLSKRKKSLVHKPTSDVEYTSSLPVVDAWLLAPYGLYDVTPKHLGVPDDLNERNEIRLVHWSVLVTCTELSEHLDVDEGGTANLVMARHVHHALRVLDELRCGYDAVPELADSLRVVTRCPEWGSQVADALQSIDTVKAEPTQLIERVRHVIETHCAYLPYEAEVSCLADDVPLREAGPTDAAFYAVAASLASMGYTVTCLTTPSAPAPTNLLDNITVTYAEATPMPPTPRPAFPLTRRYRHFDTVYHNHVRGTSRGLASRNRRAFITTLLRMSGFPSDIAETLPWKCA